MDLYQKVDTLSESAVLDCEGPPALTREAHKAQHVKMIKRVEEVLAEYQQDKDSAMNNALEYLSDWLINHINGTDKEYSSYLIERGVK